MKVWIVSDQNECGDNRIVAVYQTADLADEHVRVMGGWADDAHILEKLHPDVTDPIKQQARDVEVLKSREQYAESQRRAIADADLIASMRPIGRVLRLCHCETFTKKEGPQALIPWTEHGYCSYCGGWAPRVVAQLKGRHGLQVEIDKLSESHREKMQKIADSIL